MIHIGVMGNQKNPVPSKKILTALTALALMVLSLTAYGLSNNSDADTDIYMIGDPTPADVVAEFDDATNTLTITGTGTMTDWTKESSAPWIGAHCNEIQKVVIDNGVANIGSYAFCDCENLITIEFGTDVATIGDYTFSNTGFTTVTLPNSIESIGTGAFQNCSGLTTITVMKNSSPLTVLGQDALSGCGTLTDIFVPSNSVNDYRTAENWSSYEEMIFADISACIVSDIADQKYSGSRITPAVTVKDGTATLAPDTDYIITYGDNIDAGSGVIAVKGTGIYKGTIEMTFTIEKRSVTIESASASKKYDGEPLTSDKITVGEDGFAKGEGATYSVTGTRTDAGSSKNTFSYTLKENTKADNYTITEKEGDLTVEKATADITIIKNSSCPGITYNIGASATSGGSLTYEVSAGSDIVSISPEGKITPKNVGSAQIKIGAESTANYERCEKTFDVSVYDHIHVIIPGETPTKTKSGLTEGEECSECHKVFKQQEKIEPTGSEKSVLKSEGDSVKYAVPQYDELKTLEIRFAKSNSAIELNEYSTNAVKDTVIEFSIAAVKDTEDTYSIVTKSDGEEFIGSMNITLQFDPAKGTPSVRWTEGNEIMNTVSVDYAAETIKFSTTHNSTYTIEYQTVSDDDSENWYYQQYLDRNGTIYDTASSSDDDTTVVAAVAAAVAALAVICLAAVAIRKN